MQINTNLSSMSAQRQLTSNTSRLSKAYERLGSGLRVNSASDDAAGLAIGERMGAELRGASQAIKNNQQSISLLQTAEGALAEQTALLQRMRELSVQSLNATYQDSDRASMQAEVAQLQAQFDKISEAEFNGQRLFDRERVLYRDGELGGAGKLEKFFTSKRSERVARQSTHTSRVGVSDDALNTGDITITNDQGEAFSVRGTVDADDGLSTANKSASAIAKAKAINEHTASTGVEALVGETRLVGGKAITATTLDAQSYLKLNGEVISGFAVRERDADGSLVSAINAVSEETGVIATIDQEGALVLTAQDGRNIELEAVGQATDIGFGAYKVQGAELTLRATRQYDWAYADNTVDERLGYLFTELIDLNPGTASDAYAVGPSWQFLSTNSPTYAEPEWNGHLNNNIVLTGQYNGFNAAGGHRFHVEVYTQGAAQGVWLAQLGAEDANGESLVTQYFTPIPFDASGSGTYFFASAGTTVPAGVTGSSLVLPGTPGSNVFQFTFNGASLVDSLDNDGDGIDAFQFIAPVGNFTPTDFTVGLGFDEALGGVDVSTVNSAEQALVTIDLALEELSSERSAYGALLNAFASSVSSLEGSREALTASRSRILDADYASEVTSLTRAQITQQASTSVLAQANSEVSLALALLG